MTSPTDGHTTEVSAALGLIQAAKAGNVSAATAADVHVSGLDRDALESVLRLLFPFLAELYAAKTASQRISDARQRRAFNEIVEQFRSELGGGQPPIAENTTYAGAVDLDTPDPAAIRRTVAARIEERLTELEATRAELTALRPKIDHADFNVVDLYRLAQLTDSSLADLFGGEQ